MLLLLLELAFPFPGEETGVCRRGGKTYSVGAVWKEDCNKTTCECTPTGARCAGVSCGQFGCGPGFVYGPPDACGCPGPCVRKKNIMATFFLLFRDKISNLPVLTLLFVFILTCVRECHGAR